MTNILILSAGTRDKVVQYFKKELAGRGKVVATDCSPVAPAIYEADEYVIVPRITEEGYLETILSLCREKQISGVFSLIDPELSLLAAHREEFLAAGTVPVVPDEDVVELCFDKYRMYEKLTCLGVPTAYFGVNSFKDYLRMLEVCTMITGQEENYQTCGLDVQAQVEAAKAQNDGSAPTVLLLRSASTSCKVKNSKGTVLGEILADLGAVNIADSDTGLLEDLSLERILADDPDYIFVVFQGSDQDAAQRTLEAALTSNPAWDTLSAVQNGNFYIMEKELYHLKPNARWGEAYQKVADILYPVA